MQKRWQMIEIKSASLYKSAQYKRVQCMFLLTKLSEIKHIVRIPLPKL